MSSSPNARSPASFVSKAPVQTPATTTAQLSLRKRISFAVVVVLAGLALIEGLLAVIGIQPEKFESDPYVGFSSQSPLFAPETGSDGTSILVTAKGKRDFFNGQQFAARKPAGTFRIFSLGGSTAYGHPYTDTTSFNGWLREYLQTCAPDRKWEVINAGGISYASYREARLMEELIQYQPDLFILYGSHNEFLEQRLYGRVMGSSATMRRLSELARRSRFANLVKRATTALTADKLASTQPTQKLQDEPETVLEKTLGPTSYVRNPAQHEKIQQHYRFNLGRMVDMAQSVDAKIIFVVPAANLRDVSPFKNEHRPGLSDADLGRWKDLFEQAHRSETNAPASPTTTLALLDQAGAIDDRMALLHFARGRVLERLGRYPEAKTAYERARDEDICPLRAPEPVRNIVRETALQRLVPVIAFDQLLEPHTEHGIPGASVFLDHVHPTIEGYRLLGLEILKTMTQKGWVQPNLDPQTIISANRKVAQRLDSTAHSLALMNLCKTLGWAGKREEAFRAGKQAAQLGPQLAEVQYEAGLAAFLAGHDDEALEHYQAALVLKPTHSLAHGNLAVLLENRNQLEDAIAHYRLALQYGRPKDADRNQKNLKDALQKNARSANGGRK